MYQITSLFIDGADAVTAEDASTPHILVLPRDTTSHAGFHLYFNVSGEEWNGIHNGERLIEAVSQVVAMLRTKATAVHDNDPRP